MIPFKRIFSILASNIIVLTWQTIDLACTGGTQQYSYYNTVYSDSAVSIISISSELNLYDVRRNWSSHEYAIISIIKELENAHIHARGRAVNARKNGTMPNQCILVRFAFWEGRRWRFSSILLLVMPFLLISLSSSLFFTLFVPIDSLIHAWFVLASFRRRTDSSVCVCVGGGSPSPLALLA